MRFVLLEERGALRNYQVELYFDYWGSRVAGEARLAHPWL